MAQFYRTVIVQLLVLTSLLGYGLCALRKPVNPDQSVLIVYDEKITPIGEFSKFQDNLKQKQYDVELLNVDEEGAQLSLFVNSQRLFQNLVLFPLKIKNLGNDISAADFLEFMNDGGNVISITSPSGVQDDEKIFLNELGIFPSPQGAKVLDHFNFDAKLAKKTHDHLKLNSTHIKNNKIVSSDVSELIYAGSSATLSNSQLLIPIIQAPLTSYTMREEEVYSSGSQTHLAVGVQSRNNARALWIGSDVVFNDQFFPKHDVLINDLVDWTFGAKNVIKATSVEHYHAHDKHSEELYKIKDEVVYNIGLSEWDGQKWTPYHADDVQVEVRMLDPYYRLNLTPVEEIGESQIYSTGIFNLPDQHGMFTFFTNYKRSGISFVEDKRVVTVRHLANNEYQRSWEIPNAWVYVASNMAVVVSFLVFVFVFIYKK